QRNPRQGRGPAARRRAGRLGVHRRGHARAARQRAHGADGRGPPRRPRRRERGMTPLAEVGFYEAWWIQLLKGVLIFFVVFNLVPIALLAERKLLGRFQYRYGPNRG